MKRESVLVAPTVSGANWNSGGAINNPPLDGAMATQMQNAGIDWYVQVVQSDGSYTYPVQSDIKSRIQVTVTPNSLTTGVNVLAWGQLGDPAKSNTPVAAAAGTDGSIMFRICDLNRPTTPAMDVYVNTTTAQSRVALDTTPGCA